MAENFPIQEVTNLLGLINESYLFLYNSPKRQRLFEHSYSENLCTHSKLHGLCKTRWVRHIRLDALYECSVTYLDALHSTDDNLAVLEDGEN